MSVDHYDESQRPPRPRGIPQGTAVSLILANLAAWEVDRELERLGVGFVRYADDTLVWSHDYSSICRAVEVLHERAGEMGVAINREKSPGVSLLVPPATPAESVEIKAITSLDFLGYELSMGSARIRQRSEEKIRARMEALVYDNLLREPLFGTQHPDRLTGKVDRDYVTLLLQLRRYLYGDLAEKQVRRYQRGEIPHRRFKGLMSAYPMLTDSDQLRNLDGWLLDHIYLALRKCTRLLKSAGYPALPLPHDVPKADLTSLRGLSTSHGQTIDLSVPSLRRMATVLRRASRVHGPAGVGSALPYDY